MAEREVKMNIVEDATEYKLSMSDLGDERLRLLVVCGYDIVGAYSSESMWFSFRVSRAAGEGRSLLRLRPLASH